MPSSRTRGGLDAADAAAAACLAAWGASLYALTRGLAEPQDGLAGILNALSLARRGLPAWPAGGLLLVRPLLGSALTAPWASWAYARGGASAAVDMSHAVQIAAACVLLGLCWRRFRRSCGAAVAGLLAGLMAFNPVLLTNAPFAYFDVMGAAFAFLVLCAAADLLEEDSRSACARFAAAGALALAAKYHQGLLLGLPLLCAPWARRESPSAPRLWSPRLWLAPAAALAGAALVLAAAARGETPNLARELLANARNNLGSMDRMGLVPGYYRSALLYQLGPFAALLCLAGAVIAALRRGAAQLVWAAGLAGALLFFTFCVSRNDTRYLLCVLPCAYALIGEALLLIKERFGPRSLAFAAAVLFILAPWRASAAAVSYLLEEPCARNRSAEWLGRYARAGVESGGCLRWMAGDVQYSCPDARYRMDNWSWKLNRSAFSLYAPAPFEEIPGAPLDRPLPEPAGGEFCRFSMVLVPRRSESGGGWEQARWESSEIARIYDPRLPKRTPYLKVDDYGISTARRGER